MTLSNLQSKESELKMDKISELLIATGNRGKLAEIAELLKNIDIKALGSFEYNLPEPEENGADFAENSLIKARYYGRKTGLVSLADDSGLCIEKLDNMPGIYSARWAIDETTGERNFDLAFENIKTQLLNKGVDLDKDEIKAHFICNLSLYDPKSGFSKSFEGRVDGVITYPARGDNGFGYDPIFIPEGYGKTFAQMDSSIKDSISHRSRAFDKLVSWYNAQ